MKKVISLFLASITFALTLSVGVEEAVAPEPIAVYPAPTEQKDELNIRFSAKNQWVSNHQNNFNEKEVIETALKQLPKAHVDQLKSMVIDYNPNAHRGYGGKSMIILRGVEMSEQEMIGVLIHEMGHLVDLGFMQEINQNTPSSFMDFDTPVYEGDPSLDFYRISWTSESTYKKGARKSDFISGYSLSNPFEEFSEAYAFYVLHHDEFLAKAEANQAMAQKYLFMRDVVFEGKTFATGNRQELSKKQPWDVTVLNYELDKFIASNNG